MTEGIAPQMTEEWLAQQAEISRNRRRKVVEFFDSSFLSSEARELRALYDTESTDGIQQSGNVNHNEFIQKKEI